MAVGISPPWNTYNSMVKSLFDADPEITVGSVYEGTEDDEFDYAYEIDVSNTEKMLALNKVLDSYVFFGNVMLKQIIVDTSGGDVSPYVELYETIFKGNPHLKDTKRVEDQAGGVHFYVRFQPEVIQFYNDDLTDYNGNHSCLAEEIAYELFSNNIDPSVNFCTADLRENTDPEAVNKPLGEWP